LAKRPESSIDRRSVHVRARDSGESSDRRRREEPFALPARGKRLVRFWSGAKLDGGRRIIAEAPLDRIPLYVRGGSILPFGPEVEYAEQRTNEPIELRVYRGSDGSFTLYDDRGDTYAYEKGERSIVPLRWDDKSTTMTIGARQGEYPGMPHEQEFRVVLVGGSKAGPSKQVRYAGQELAVRLE